MANNGKGNTKGRTANKSAGRSGAGKTSGRATGKTSARTSSRSAGGSRAKSAGGSARAGSTRSAASRSSKGSQAQQGDALEILKSQHREVESLFKQFERAENDNECFEVAQVICQKLTVHATIEEEAFYPAARSQGEDGELKDQVLEAIEEHLSVKRLIADIQELEVGDERLEAKVSVLKEQVSHHVEEEEGELFPSVKKEISKDERQTLGQQLLQRTEELEGEAGEATEQESMEARGGSAGAQSSVSEEDQEEDSNSDSASRQQRGDSSRSSRSSTPHAHH